MDTLVSLDLETTGLDPDHDAITEVAVIRFCGDEVLDQWRTFVNPGRPIPPFIRELTGIRQSDVDNAPPFSSLRGKLAAAIGSSPIVGHNIGFDLAFLRRYGMTFANPAFDTRELAAILLPWAGRFSLKELADRLGFPHPNVHRALSDADTTRKLFLYLLEQARRLPEAVLREIVVAARRIPWSLKAVFEEALDSAISSSAPRPPSGRDDGLGLFRRPPLERRSLRKAATFQPLDADQLAALLEDEGAFAQKFPGFEHRPQQVEMLRAVSQALSTGRHLIVEAPTGVGKGLAYLIPAVHWAVQNGCRVVISTNTINLQDQLMTKDIPALRQVLGLDFRAAMLKGRSNYLCPRRFQALRHAGPTNVDEMRLLARLLIWLPTTESGDRAELNLSAREAALWASLLSAENELCTHERCAAFGGGICPLYRARRQAEAAHIVVVNHALLLADIATENSVLPEYDHLIIDEAHHLEEAVTNGLSFHADRGEIERLIAEIGRSRAGLIGDVLAACRRSLPEAIFADMENSAAKLSHTAELMASTVADFFGAVTAFLENQREWNGGEYSQKLWITPAVRQRPGWERVAAAWENLSLHLGALAGGLARLGSDFANLEEYDIPDWDELLARIMAVQRRLTEVRAQTDALLAHPSDQMIYWLELDWRGLASIHVAPLNVGPLVERYLFQAKASVVLTSATLRTGKSFNFIKDRLHAWECQELAVGSPFDYENSTLLYLVNDIPEPDQPGYQQAVERVLVELCKATRGRALVLFTSHSQLQATARAIAEPLERAGILVFEQGEGGSRRQLLEGFRLSERAVLLGTRSFWEGVDVPGQALSSLIITRLPFTVPSEPIFAARSQTFKQPFQQYAVPEAILRFRQGFGRLIRSRSDRGVVTVLDRRILTKAYGRHFLESLPACTVRRGPASALPALAARWIDGPAAGTEAEVRTSFRQQ